MWYAETPGMQSGAEDMTTRPGEQTRRSSCSLEGTKEERNEGDSEA